MAKQTLEAAKAELSALKASVEILKQSGVKDIPASMLETIARLEKQIAGNAGENFISLANSTIGKALNDRSAGNQELVDAIAAIVGENGVRVLVKVVKNAEGVNTLEFATPTVARQTTATGEGKPRAARSGNSVYVIEVLTELPDYAEKTATTATAAGALAFIVNGGKNPLNLGAGYGKGDSAVRVLEKIAKLEAFKANFKVTVEAAPAKTTEAEATAKTEELEQTPAPETAEQ